MSISEELLNRQLITRENLGEANELHKSKGTRLDRAHLELGHVTEPDLLEVLADVLSLNVIDVSTTKIEAQTLRLLPPRFVYKKRIVPLNCENGTIQVVTSDPYGLYSFDEIQLMTGLTVEPVLALSEDVDKLIKMHYGVGGDTIDELVGADDIEILGAVDDESQDLLEMAQEASVIKLVNEIILEAINERASDVHIEPFENGLVIRYRVDGVLQEAALPPQIHRFQAAIISRIKILAGMNIAEKRLPQDGRIKFQVGNKQIDVRVSVIPMLFGEGVVLRVLDRANVLLELPDLGMEGEILDQFRELIQRPHGIILVTGPTGSGKTTTLYAALNAIVGPEMKVLTVEDPVEYHLEGVNQIPVHPKIGMTFARGLRAILRHDPDVVMIGEVRDIETAEAATQAALTGHLVLSTLHTNDAASAATRLIDMGVEPFLVSSTLIGAMAQRLVRVNCENCKAEYTPGPEDVLPGFPISPERTLMRGVGCPACRKTGFRGRMGLYELLCVNAPIAEKIMERVPSIELVRVGRESGLKTLREDGWKKVLAGVTTPAEVARSTAE